MPGAESQIANVEIEIRLHPAATQQTLVLQIYFRRDAASLRLFTTIATLGTPRDVTLEEIRIEFFFPMDEPTAHAFARRAK